MDRAAWFERFHGPIEHEVRSDHSTLRVRRRGDVRCLTLVRSSGAEVLQSQIDLSRPHELRFDGLRYALLSYAYRPRQDRVAVLGLGGGGLVRFLRHHDPDLRIDAVEIDPEVARIAERYFGVVPDDRTAVVVQDASAYLSACDVAYDVLYLDAFVGPSADTDASGAPLSLRSADFHRLARSRLSPGGVLTVNLNPHRGLEGDLANLREAFPAARVHELPDAQGCVAIGTTAEVVDEDLEAAARAADRRLGAGFSLAELLGSSGSV